MSNADLVTFFSLAHVWRGKRLVVSPFTLDRPGASWIVSWRTQKELADWQHVLGQASVSLLTS